MIDTTDEGDEQVMNIDITNDEKVYIKARVIAQVEQRLTEELLTNMRREVTRETIQKTYASAKERLTTLLTGHITDEMIQAQIQKALGALTVEQYGKPEIKKLIENAVLRVVEAHGMSVAEELKNLLYETLRKSFYKPSEG